MIRKSISLTFPTTKFLFAKHFFVTREILISILYSKYSNIPKLPRRQHIYENTNFFYHEVTQAIIMQHGLQDLYTLCETHSIFSAMTLFHQYSIKYCLFLGFGAHLKWMKLDHVLKEAKVS